MIDFEKMRTTETTYTFIPRGNSRALKNLKLALELSGEKDWEIIIGSEKMIEEIKAKVPEGQNPRRYVILVSKFDPEAILAVYPYIYRDPDVQSAREKQDYEELKKSWDSAIRNYGYDDEDTSPAQGGGRKSRIQYVAADFFSSEDMEREKEALLTENEEAIAAWLQDDSVKESIRFTRREGDDRADITEPGPQRTARQGNSILCEYMELHSAIQLVKDEAAESGFRVHDVYLLVGTYMREFDAEDEIPQEF